MYKINTNEYVIQVILNKKKSYNLPSSSFKSIFNYFLRPHKQTILFYSDDFLLLPCASVF